MPIDDSYYTPVQDPATAELAWATSLGEFQLADRVALRPESHWHSAGERTGMVVGVPGGWVRVRLDTSGRKVKIRCRDLAVIAIPIRCRAVTEAIMESKDFQ
ncbi:hypothetical protein [Mycobacterium sp. NPDC006124]|uniref:hypothetical protein n=1 Tax=Mycobacterium sp. NPDC006124 TaxID=3156729 RepID=UPI0033B221B7